MQLNHHPNELTAAAQRPRVARNGAGASLIGTIKRADGRLQVTYNHHPLYTFAQDTKAGQTNGEGADAFGARWYPVSPAGATTKKRSSSSGRRRLHALRAYFGRQGPLS
jgi:Secreted repeat of unknown function